MYWEPRSDVLFQAQQYSDPKSSLNSLSLSLDQENFSLDEKCFVGASSQGNKTHWI